MADVAAVLGALESLFGSTPGLAFEYSSFEIEIKSRRGGPEVVRHLVHWISDDELPSITIS